MTVFTSLAGSSSSSPLDQASRGNIASTPQHNSPPATWPPYMTHRPASPYHHHTPTAHPPQHHAHHHKMQNASTTIGQVLHHEPPTISAMTPEPESVLAPVTPVLTNYSLQCHSNLRSPRHAAANMLTPPPETASPAAVADPYPSLTDFLRRA